MEGGLHVWKGRTITRPRLWELTLYIKSMSSLSLQKSVQMKDSNREWMWHWSIRIGMRHTACIFYHKPRSCQPIFCSKNCNEVKMSSQDGKWLSLDIKNLFKKKKNLFNGTHTHYPFFCQTLTAIQSSVFRLSHIHEHTGRIHTQGGYLSYDRGCRLPTHSNNADIFLLRRAF